MTDLEKSLWIEWWPFERRVVILVAWDYLEDVARPLQVYDLP